MILGLTTMDMRCDQILYPEFPEAKFGEYKNNLYFNATQLIQKTEEKLDVYDVIKKSLDRINLVWEAYPHNETASKYGVNEESNTVFMHECLFFVFLKQIDKDFYLYTNDIVKFLFQNGFALSDTMMAQAVRTWITPEIYNKIRNGINS